MTPEESARWDRMVEEFLARFVDPLADAPRAEWRRRFESPAVARQASDPMQHISLKGVILGTLLGLLLDALSGIALTILLGSGAVAPGAGEAEVRRALAEVAHSTPFLLGGVVLGSLSTVVGGYVSARVAGRLPYMNAAAVGVVGLALCAFFADGTQPLWFNALAFASALPLALVGGHLAKRRQQAGKT